MRTIFFNTAWMKYYRGNTDEDKPNNGGKFIKRESEGAEMYNFSPAKTLQGDTLCFGYASTVWREKIQQHSQLRIENIEGCSLMKNENSVDNVLVVWCSTYEPKNYRIVGWYNNATVFRRHQDDKYGLYISCADVSGCVLLPEITRFEKEWAIPRAKDTGYGFGQANMWYPAKYPESKEWLDALIKRISEYKGENLVNDM